ncbi:MAG TPA: hypothetical protein VGX92_17595 [Pyrinomonadaceae bacterium]|jgi:hypothetical protein|nr:hypothetical protein [Pyrinomonadaceae bacterium]
MGDTYPGAQVDERVEIMDAASRDSEDWPAKIETVLEQRKPYAVWLRGAKSYLNDLQAQLNRLDQQREELSTDPVFQPYLRGIAFGDLTRRAEEQQQQLSELGRRFERDTLNVVVVGTVNQGKSFLLRTLSGLPPSVIPDRGSRHSQLDPLTGARSTIIHEKGGPIRGRVLFYSEQNLLAVLNDYRAELLKALGRAPDNSLVAPYLDLDDFQQRPLAPEAQEAVTPGRYGALLKQLKKYKQLLVNDRSYIGRAPLENLLENDILGFVTQSTAEEDERRAYLHLAVEAVEIKCQFPHERVGKIALIDLPGLGEATLGGPERLLQTLRLDADIALFVWRPMPGDLLEGNELIGLYDICYQAMKHILPLHEWSFLVLNHDRTNNNLAICEEGLRKIREKEAVFKFFSERICDCSSPEEVRDEVLRHVLNHLALKIGGLDRRVAASCAQAIDELTRDTLAMLQKALAAFGGAAEGLDEKEFERLFLEKWEALSLGLNNLVAELQEKVDAPDESFVREVKDSLEACKSHKLLLSAEGLQKEIDADTSLDRILINHQIWMRAQISDSLRVLDGALDQPLLAVKTRVANIFDADAGLGSLVQHNQFEPLCESLALYSPPLREAFDNLVDFRMSARGLIGYKIRTKLQALEPRRTPAKAAPMAELTSASQEPAERKAAVWEEPPWTFRIKTRTENAANNSAAQKRDGADQMGGGHAYQHLVSLVSNTLDEIEKALSEDYSRPNQVAYTIVADFVDRVIHARQSKTEWRNVYRSLREKVWPLEYELRRRRQQKREQWCASLQRVVDATRQTAPTLPIEAP